MASFLSDEAKQAMNTVGENLFIADETYTIVWINDYAERLIHQLSSYMPVKGRTDLIGRNISDFHSNDGEKQRRILKNGPFPFESNIVLFNHFQASIVVNPYFAKGEVVGYVLTWKDVTEYEERIDEISVPVIDLWAGEVLMLPLIGSVNSHRIKVVTEKLLSTCSEKQARYLLCDFTGVTNVSGDRVMQDLDKVIRGLGCMGINVIFTGIPISLVQEFIKEGVHIDVPTFRDVKQALSHLKSMYA